LQKGIFQNELNDIVIKLVKYGISSDVSSKFIDKKASKSIKPRNGLPLSFLQDYYFEENFYHSYLDFQYDTAGSGFALVSAL
jgi:hypothetical protein